MWAGGSRVFSVWHPACPSVLGCGHGSHIDTGKEAKRMNRFLLIDQDDATAQRLGLGCFAEGIAVIIAENVCEGVRRLATTPVSLIVVDVGGLRLGAREHAALFDCVAPGVPVVVAVRPDVPLETRVALELAGFRVLPKPLAPDELLKTLVSAEV